MSDTFGLLPLPVPAPAAGKSLSDPALDMVLDFMQSVLNARLNPGWAARSPVDSLPVAYVFPWAPDLEIFDTTATPALYLWRSDGPGGVHKFAEDFITDEDGMSGLWVPPPMAREDKALRDTVKNGFKKALKVALAQGRDPAWKLAGDNYYDAQDWGSVLLYHTKMGKCRLGKVQNHTLIIQSDTNTADKTPFECIFFTLDTFESFTDDLSKYQPIASIHGTMDLGDPSQTGQAGSLTFQSYVFDPVVASLDIVTGPAAGGTVVTIQGSQFPTELDDDVAVTVTIGGIAVFGDVINESQIVITTPAHAAGVVDVSVLFPSGVSKTLAGAFTYT